MSHLFFLLSGEHPTLPYAEVEALLEGEEIPRRIVGFLPQVLRLEADEERVKRVFPRLALARIFGIEIFECKSETETILRQARRASYTDLIEGEQTLAVRVKRVRGSALKVDVEKLEKGLGKIILEKVDNIRVNLEKPKKVFFGVLTGKKFVFGLKSSEISPKPFTERKPRKRPFFHPSAMPPKLARCMVNLARIKPNDVVLDPFCGTGTILIEAGLIGCKTLGADIKPQMARGCLKNLRHYGIEPLGITVADARELPLKGVNHIVTDPPYGISATTFGQTTKKLVADFLSTAKDLLPRCGHLCIASPKTIKVCEISEDAGFKIVEKHFVYVHRSLTREIVVLKNP